jgi:glycosyltransferase involved in cell wall biosynthesis
MPRRPRLLVLITLAEVGGAQTYVANVVAAAAPHFDVTLAAHGEGPLEQAALAAGARYIPLRHVRRPISVWSDLLGWFELVRLFRRERPDIVHANSSKAGFLGCLAATLVRVPIRLFTVNGWAFFWHSGHRAAVYLWADRAIGRLATRVICVAQEERRLGIEARACKPERTVVIPNAVDVSRALRAAHESEVPTLITVGRFQAPKDFVTLLAALDRIRDEAWNALVVGDGPDRPLLEEEIERRGLEHVELLGERDDVPRLLSSADLFVLSTRSEGLPLSILEAMAAGLPVVASAVGGVPELVVDGETGLLVPPGREEPLASALRSLVRDRDSRTRLGRAGRTRAERMFDLPEFGRAHLALYRAELERRGLPLPA